MYQIVLRVFEISVTRLVGDDNVIPNFQILISYIKLIQDVCKPNVDVLCLFPSDF